MTKQRGNQPVRIVDIAGNTVDWIISNGENTEQNISTGYVPSNQFAREGGFISVPQLQVL